MLSLRLHVYVLFARFRCVACSDNFSRETYTCDTNSTNEDEVIYSEGNEKNITGRV